MKSLFWYLTISKVRWIFFPCLLLCLESFGQGKEVKFFFSKDGKVPLAYLRLLSLDGKQALLTDGDGKLEFFTSEVQKNSEYNISGFGINDTLLSMRQIMSYDTVYLEIKDFELPEIAINASQLTELKIGDSSAEGWEVTKPIELKNGPAGEFFRYTIRVKIPKKDQLYLDRIKFYVSNILSGEVDVSLRVLIPSSGTKIVPGKINSISNFTELLHGNKIIEISASGWQQYKFEELVPIPKGARDLFIVFDLLETEPMSQFAIANQKNSKDIDLGFYITGGKIGVANLDPIHPAIELVFLKD